MDNFEELLKENLLIKKDNENLKLEIKQLREHLKKYTSPIKNIIYYEAQHYGIDHYVIIQKTCIALMKFIRLVLLISLVY